ncbi:IS110 family transposase [Microcoleus sp. AR_TQ3_B6]|uniref:IS110 family transposase n=1 Tax=Microcoleus sp. AR_TQ3_B6 TaxID=3055284 RepID=UPI00403FA356
MLVWKPLAFWRDALAEFLYGEGFQVSIVNPAPIKGFAKSELLRTKTDSVDATFIARFCAAIKPSLWTPTAPELKELQAGVTASRISHRNDDERTKPFGNGYANSCCPYPGTLGLSSAATTTNQKTDW